MYPEARVVKSDTAGKADQAAGVVAMQLGWVSILAGGGQLCVLHARPPGSSFGNRDPAPRRVSHRLTGARTLGVGRGTGERGQGLKT